MTTLSTTWNSGGQPYTVTVTQRTGEDIHDTAQRLADAESALKALKPKDP